MKFQIIYCSGAMHSKLSDDEDYPGKLMGSWTTAFGDQDTAGDLDFFLLYKPLMIVQLDSVNSLFLAFCI